MKNQPNQPNQQPFYTDQYNLHILKTNVSRVKPLLSAIVEEFAKIEIEIKFITEITDLLDSNRLLDEEKLNDFIFNRLHPSIPTGMDKVKFRQLCTMPEVTQLIEVFQVLRAYQASPNWVDRIYFDVYTITGGKVIIDTEKLTEVCRPYQEYINNPMEEKRLSLVLKLCDTLTEMAKLTAPGEFAGTLAISNICTFSEGKFTPLPTYVKTGYINSTAFISQTRETGLKKSSPSKQKASVPNDTPEAAMARQRNN